MFKVGETVVCVDPTGELVKYEKYVVKYVAYRFIRVEGVDGVFVDSRFIEHSEKDYEITMKGKKYDKGKPDISLLPMESILRITEVFDYGKNKYGPHNWREGLSWTRLSSAALRHLFAWIMGEDKDKESGLSHVAHACANLIMLLSFIINNSGEDNRYKNESNK